MTAHTQNILLKSLLKQETHSGRSSLPNSPSQVVEKTRQENDAWCVVATDGSTSIITCKSASNTLKSNGRKQAIAEDQARNLKNRDECLPDAPKAGVDLSSLNVEKETTSKLIAGMQAMTVDQAASSLQREIEMPSAKTDLQEIFKADNVCVISRPKSTS